jgi:hypothetical protein
MFCWGWIAQYFSGTERPLITYRQVSIVIVCFVAAVLTFPGGAVTRTSQ